MKAILLAAGPGTRLRPLTLTTPKCLVAIGGKPLLGHWFDLLLRPSGIIDRVIVNTHYLPEPVRAYVASSPFRDRITLVHEETLLLTGGTVLANRCFYGREPVLVAHADNLTHFDPKAFLQRHSTRPPKAVMTMMTFETDAPATCGIVEEAPSGIVVAFHEKVPAPPGNRANAAVYIIEPEVVDDMASLGRATLDLSIDVIPRFLGRIWTFHNDDYHRDIGTMESLRRAEADYR
ncbi:MAG: nucleotidyltransferase family protein [Acidobacteriota bacterium]